MALIYGRMTIEDRLTLEEWCRAARSPSVPDRLVDKQGLACLILGTYDAESDWNRETIESLGQVLWLLQQSYSDCACCLRNP